MFRSRSRRDSARAGSLVCSWVSSMAVPLGKPNWPGKTTARMKKSQSMPNISE
ncbi:hypothetical protein [Streptomyces sp. 8L]|uniref:hypothetical protein n=1 Tax=Streptomyces sp. 8L TaxID=2877242 RepID=UPI001CD7BAC2|nr:hypothetical protein [Streptomyces sp. 8L]MCA1224004.1 hypothetical protein [Streptomyces sp. 8L]